MRRPLTPWLIGVSLLLPAAALAQPQTHGYPECNREPTEGDVAAAKGAFQAGQGSFNEADYARAITYWEDAYRRDCTAHALLLNLARAYELSGQKRPAVMALETFLLRKPDYPQRGQIERRIEVLNSQLAQEAQTAPTPSPSSTPTQAPTPVALDAPSTDEPGTRRPLLPLFVAGGGGVIALVGGILHLKARSDLNGVKDQCPDGDCGTDTSLADEGNSANTRVNVTGAITIGGLAIAAGGVVWYFLSKPESAQTGAAALPKQSARPQLTPAVGRNFTGLAVTGRF
jgi:tetratricopeptide (TPR) repeat protein